MKREIMTAKFFVYLFTIIVVIYAMDALRINEIFKKNKVFQARLFYLLVALSMTYLVANFIMDFFINSQIY